MNRIEEIAQDITGKSSDQLMLELMEACNDTVTPCLLYTSPSPRDS